MALTLRKPYIALTKQNPYIRTGLQSPSSGYLHALPEHDTNLTYSALKKPDNLSRADGKFKLKHVRLYFFAQVVHIRLASPQAAD